MFELHDTTQEPDAPLKRCKLCEAEAPLRKSHVIPKFVNRWLLETSPGYIRTVKDPNLRIQDGPTEEWLCDSCEQRFSDWEKPFAENVFQHIHANPTQPIAVEYGDWALKFATSVSWRTLLYYRDKESHIHSEADNNAMTRADRAWRNFLLGQAPHPGEFEQHTTVVDTLKQASDPVSPFLNRYFLRTVHSDLVTSKSMCFTYTKLGRIVIFGFIRMHPSRKWKGTKLHVTSGRIGGDCEIPDLVMRYWNDKADQGAAAIAAMSQKQKAKVNQMFASSNPDELANSEVFRAMQSDVELSGKLAFEVTKKQEGG